MKRFAAWGWAIATTLIAIAINGAVEYLVGFDISFFMIAVAIPAGTMALVALGLSGYLWGSASTGHVSDTVDLVFLMGLAFVVPLGIYAYEYAWYLSTVAPHNPPSFGAFVNDQIVNTRIQMYGRGLPHDAAPVKAGGIGLLASLIKLGALPAIAKVIHSVSKSGDRPDEERARPTYANWQ